MAQTLLRGLQAVVALRTSVSVTILAEIITKSFPELSIFVIFCDLFLAKRRVFL